MTASRIEWTERSDWNPLRGCTRMSEGCRYCYAEAIAARFSDPGQAFHGFAERTAKGPRWTGRVEVMWDRLELPLSWRRPALIFGSSTSDLFHEALGWEDSAAVYAVAVAAHHLRGHRTQFLTKRAERMRQLLARDDWWDCVNSHAGMLVTDRVDPLDRRSDDARATLDEYGPGKPPPGVWLGVSVEDQATADARVPELLATPATLRFLSCEPLLGPVQSWHDLIADRAMRLSGEYYDDLPGIDWVIAGGESGRGARPMHPDWPRGLRDQCAAAGVPFFFKQWGEWAPRSAVDATTFNLREWESVRLDEGTAAPLFLFGKARAGRLLDGVQHDGMPA